MEAYKKLNAKQKKEFDAIFKKAEKLIGVGERFKIDHKGIRFYFQTIWTDDGLKARTHLISCETRDEILKAVIDPDGDLLDEFFAKHPKVIVISKKVEKQIKAVFNEVWSEYVLAQNKYDEETQHGLITENQNEWIRNVDYWLSK